jgi:hypothetical protein
MIEPVFAHTKHNRMITRFHRRGRRVVRTEWRLLMATHNLTKLHRHQLSAAGALRQAHRRSHREKQATRLTPALTPRKSCATASWRCDSRARAGARAEAVVRDQRIVLRSDRIAHPARKRALLRGRPRSCEPYGRLSARLEHPIGQPLKLLASATVRGQRATTARRVQRGQRIRLYRASGRTGNRDLLASIATGGIQRGRHRVPPLHRSLDRRQCSQRLYQIGAAAVAQDADRVCSPAVVPV